MATKYTINFTDTTKASFDVQPFSGNGPVSPSDPTIINSAVSANTTLKLYGKSFQDYGEGVFQDLVYLIENFANGSRPVFSVEGQIWYNNSTTGSPISQEQLFIRNSTGTGDDLVNDWDAIIMATGSSPMTGELVLSGNPIGVLGAVPKQYVDAHINDLSAHITPDQNIFLDGLTLTGSPSLTAVDVNQLIGITSNVQTQLNDKVSLSGDTMAAAANLTFMGGEILGLPTSPTQSSAATSAAYVDAHITDTSVHLSADQNTFLDALNLPTLTGAEVNELVGVTSNVQSQLDTKIGTSGAIMASGANITFATAGEVLGLPATPSQADAATSKTYVDALVISGAGGDGKLTQTNWVNAGLGSPTPNILETTLRFTITNPDLTFSTIDAVGISRVGHTHLAADVAIDNTFNVLHGGTVQSSIEYLDSAKANLLNPTFTNDVIVTGNVTSAPPVLSNQLATKGYVDSLSGTISRKFEQLAATLTAPGLYSVPSHTIGDNRLSITINGIKQYAHTNGTQTVAYYDTIVNSSITALDPTDTYDFDISIDGGAATTITIIAGGSPGTVVTTHSDLVNAINAQLIGSPPTNVTFGFIDGIETFTVSSSGATSTVAITDPATANTYLFATDPTPLTIIAATFLSNDFVAGSPAPIPDDITVAGDQTANFPVGKTFTINGSVEPTYGSYDGVYSVHANGAVFDSVNTIIPVANPSIPIVNTPLLPLYDPTGSPPPSAPVPSPFGNILQTPLGNFNQLNVAVAGIDGDYKETNILSGDLLLGDTTDYIEFNYDILSGSKIESLLL